MLDKYLNWELTGTQIHKYAAHKYCRCKDFAKLSLTTAVFRQRDICKEPFQMFNIQMSHQNELKKECQIYRVCCYLAFTNDPLSFAHPDTLGISIFLFKYSGCQIKQTPVSCFKVRLAKLLSGGPDSICHPRKLPPPPPPLPASPL